MKQRPLKVNFSSDDQAWCLAAAEYGQGDVAIIAHTGLTPSKITYRLRRAKERFGLQEGFRVLARRGKSPHQEQIDHLIAVRAAQIKKTVPNLFLHPVPGKTK